MTTGSFWKGLTAVIALSLATLWVMHALLPDIDAWGAFSLWTIAVFTAIVIGAFYLGQMAVRSESKARFIQLVMMIIFVKMMVCILLVGIYIKIEAPDSRLFVVPFLAIYLIFTIFEVIVLERIARTKLLGTQESSKTHL